MSGGGKKREPLSPFAGKLKALKDKMAADDVAPPAKAGAKVPAKGAAPAPAPAGRPAPARVKATPAPVSSDAEDALAFHRMMSGVTPLGGEGAHRVPRSAADAASAANAAERREDARAAVDAEATAVRAHLRELVEGGARFEVRDDGHHVEGRRPDVSQDTFRQLRRGSLPIDTRLDLHGFSAAEARVELEAFLRLVRARGDRCVLIIHGKGDHSPRGHAVLRGEISAWLAQGSASESVAAFATAQPEDGGEGAVYVLVRR